MKMDVCRSCLTADRTLQMDETLVDTYNLLTNLNISLNDGLSQLICLECSTTLNNYNIFRDNCIASETSLRQLLEQQKIDINELTISHLNNTSQSPALDVNKEELKEELVFEPEYLDSNYLDDPDFDNDEETAVKEDNINYEKLTPLFETESKGKPKRKSRRSKNEIGSTRFSQRIKKNAALKTVSKNNNYPCGLCVNSFDNKPDLTEHVESHKDEYLVCGICEESFHSWPALVGHRLSHIKKRTQCHLCSLSMCRPLYMEGHFVKKHCDKSESIQLMCTSCNKTFATAKRLQEHIKLSHSEKQHQCPECNKKFTHNSQLQIHKKSHNIENRNGVLKKSRNIKKSTNASKTNTNYPCGLCIKEFDHKPDLAAHVETHKTGMLSCKLCDEIIPTWPSLVGHRLAHNKQLQFMQCHLCSVSKLKPAYMEMHFIKKHCDPSENKKLMCQPCNKSYVTARKLQQHIAYCHKEKRFPCNRCGKKFIAKNVLRAHMISHDGGRVYACDKCEYKTKTRNSLRSHKLKSHSEFMWKCNNCKYLYDDEARFKKHLLLCSVGKILCTICGKMPKSMKSHLKSHLSVRFKCDMCPKSYYSKKSLSSHIEQHSGIRKHMCEFCPMKFFAKCILVKHRRIHTGEKPFVCKVCYKGFTGNHNLRVHMRVHGEYLIKKKGEEENIKIS